MSRKKALDKIKLALKMVRRTESPRDRSILLDYASHIRRFYV